MFGCQCFLVIFALMSPIFCSNQVPLLLWSSDRSSTLPQVSSLQTVTAPEFKSEFLEKIDKSNPFIIFIQDMLSVEDFSIYGNAYEDGKDHDSFENVASSVSLGSSVMMPSVDGAESTLLTLADEKGAAVLTDGAYELPKEENDIILVHLPATAESDRAKSLAKNDEIIGNVLREVTARYPKYTAVYTGSHSEWADGLEEPEPSYLNRHVLQANVDTGNATVYPGQIIDTVGCALLYVENVTVFIAHVNVDGSSTADTNYTLKNPEITATASNECSKLYNWTLTYKDENFTKLEVIMAFELDRRQDWYLRDMSIEFELGADKKGNNSLNVHNVWAPTNFSYHCAGDYFKTALTTMVPGSYLASLRFARIQLQPFNVTGTVFGEPWDCVGFFTIGIWMGILVALIMIVALGIGITALASIHTNDRFDDPKGKPLIINIVE